MQNYDQIDKKKKNNYASKCERLICKTCNQNLETKEQTEFLTF